MTFSLNFLYILLSCHILLLSDSLIQFISANKLTLQRLGKPWIDTARTFTITLTRSFQRQLVLALFTLKLLNTFLIFSSSPSNSYGQQFAMRSMLNVLPSQQHSVVVSKHNPHLVSHSMSVSTDANAMIQQLRSREEINDDLRKRRYRDTRISINKCNELISWSICSMEVLQ